jgi:hypothetical protein
MSADPKMWRAFIEWCERQIAEREVDLVSLESGSARLGRRGADTGGEWIDTTASEIQRFKSEIADLESVIAGNKHQVEQTMR